MSEIPRFYSAELEYEMSPYEIRAVAFAHDPIAYLSKVGVEYRASHAGADFDIVFVLLDEFESLKVAMEDDALKTENQELLTYFSAEDAFTQKCALITLFKKAGVLKSEFVTWAKVETEGSTAAEKLDERSDMVAINHVYGTDS